MCGLAVNQFGRKLWQSIVLAFRPAIFNLQVLALDEALLFQPLAEGPHAVGVAVGRCGVKETDHRHRRLLRPRCERPRHRRATNKRDELAALHVWMAPAWQEKM